LAQAEEMRKPLNLNLAEALRPKESPSALSVALKDFTRRRKRHGSSAFGSFLARLAALGASERDAELVKDGMFSDETRSLYKIDFAKRVRTARERIVASNPHSALSRIDPDKDNLIDDGPQDLSDIDTIADYLVYLETGK
jgi:hypothetical protein